MSDIEIPAEIVPLTPEEEAAIAEYEAGQYDRELAAVKLARHAAYTAPDGSDALFMKYSRQEDGITKQAWLDRVAEINAAHPYPEQPK